MDSPNSNFLLREETLQVQLILRPVSHQLEGQRVRTHLPVKLGVPFHAVETIAHKNYSIELTRGHASARPLH